jgi:AraC family transcriptional regulator
MSGTFGEGRRPRGSAILTRYLPAGDEGMAEVRKSMPEIRSIGYHEGMTKRKMANQHAKSSPALRGPREAAATQGLAFRLRHLYGSVATYQPGDTLGPRVIRDYELVWMVRGGATYVAGGRTFEAGPGSLVLARPHRREQYLWHRREPTFHAFCHFDFDAPLPHWPATRDWPTVITLEPDDVIGSLMRYVIDAWCRRFGVDAVPGAEISTVFAALLQLVLTGRKPSPGATDAPHPPAVERALHAAMRWIESPRRHRIDLDALAKAAAVTPKHLCRLFTQHLGFSPMQVLRLMRLERAAWLLGRSNLSVQQVAARCGFASPFHFSRCFREAYSQSPSELRQSLEAGHPLPRSPLPLHIWPARQW